MDCLFCKIANKEEPADIIYENDRMVAFKNIDPKTPVHLLIIPKKHIPSVDRLEKEDGELVGELVLLAQKLAQEKGIDKTGYQLAFNVGKDAGQTVEHLHLHLMGGEKLPWA